MNQKLSVAYYLGNTDKIHKMTNQLTVRAYLEASNYEDENKKKHYDSKLTKKTQSEMDIKNA